MRLDFLQELRYQIWSFHLWWIPFCPLILSVHVLLIQKYHLFLFLFELLFPNSFLWSVNRFVRRFYYFQYCSLFFQFYVLCHWMKADNKLGFTLIRFFLKFFKDDIRSSWILYCKCWLIYSIYFDISYF